MPNKRLNQLTLYAFVVFLTLMDAFFTHGGALRGLTEASSALGVSPETLRVRSLTLAALDAAAGAGALLAVLALARFVRFAWLRRARRLTIFGLTAYAGFQFWSLAVQLPPEARPAAGGAALLYLALGGLAWYLGA